MQRGAVTVLPWLFVGEATGPLLNTFTVAKTMRKTGSKVVSFRVVGGGGLGVLWCTIQAASWVCPGCGLSASSRLACSRPRSSPPFPDILAGKNPHTVLAGRFQHQQPPVHGRVHPRAHDWHAGPVRVVAARAAHGLPGHRHGTQVRDNPTLHPKPERPACSRTARPSPQDTSAWKTPLASQGAQNTTARWRV